MLSFLGKRKFVVMSDIPQLVTNVHRLSTVLAKVGDRTLQQEYGFGISQFNIIWMLHINQ